MRAVGWVFVEVPLTLHLDDGDGDNDDDDDEDLPRYPRYSDLNVAGLNVSNTYTSTAYPGVPGVPGVPAAPVTAWGGAGGSHPPAERERWSVSSLSSSVVCSCRGPFATVTATATATASASATLHSHATSPRPTLSKRPCRVSSPTIASTTALCRASLSISGQSPASSAAGAPPSRPRHLAHNRIAG